MKLDLYYGHDPVYKNISCFYEIFESMTEQAFVNAVYRWVDDNCVVILSGMDSIRSLEESELMELGNKEYTHKISLSAKAIQDPSLDFVSVVSDGWHVGVKLLVVHGEVYRWLVTDRQAEPRSTPVTYLVRHMPELNEFIAEVMQSSKNITVWG